MSTSQSFTSAYGSCGMYNAPTFAASTKCFNEVLFASLSSSCKTMIKVGAAQAVNGYAEYISGFYMAEIE